MNLKPLAVAILGALPFFAHAQASAVREDYCEDGRWIKDECSRPVSNITVTVNIPMGLAGRPGAIYIGARATSGAPGDIANINYDTLGLWLYTARGWEAFSGGAYTPIAAYEALPGTVVFRVAERANLCDLVADKNMELWAGFGVLSRENDENISLIASQASAPITPEHLRAVFTYEDMKTAQRYWNILNVTPLDCRANGAGGGWVSGS